MTPWYVSGWVGVYTYIIHICIHVTQNNAHCIIRSFCKYNLHIRIIVTIYLILLLAKNQLRWKLKEPWTTVLPLPSLPVTFIFSNQNFYNLSVARLERSTQRPAQWANFPFQARHLGFFDSIVMTIIEYQWKNTGLFRVDCCTTRSFGGPRLRNETKLNETKRNETKHCPPAKVWEPLKLV